MNRDRYISPFLWSAAITVPGILLAALMAGCFGFHPFSDAAQNLATAAHNVVPETPFQRDLSRLMTPIIWVCFIGGVGTLIASFWVPLVSPRVSLAAVGVSFGLLWIRDVLIAHPWLVPVGIVVPVMVFLWPWLHATIDALRGKADKFPTTKAALLSLVPGASPPVQP